MRAVWTIAASDSGGGAGIERDLKTFADFGVHGCSVITACTCQNTSGVRRTLEIPADFVAETGEHLLAEGTPGAVKIGVIPSRECLEVVSGLAQRLRQGPDPAFLIYDPVLTASAGQDMSRITHEDLFRSTLLSSLDLVTPNLPELVALARGLAACRGEDPGSFTLEMGQTLEGLDRMAAYVRTSGVRAVLVTGGHSHDGEHLHDVLYTPEGERIIFRSRYIASSCKHGTGCLLSSALAALAAEEYCLEDAVTAAVMYAGKAVSLGYSWGHGAGTPASGFDRDDPRFLPVIVSSFDEPLPEYSFPREDMRLGLYPVVDSTDWLRRLLPLGVATAQLRIKDPDHPALREEIREAVALGREHGARVYVDDHWELALECGAWGVHLGQEDLLTADLGRISRAGMHLGVSTHGYYEIARVLPLRPSYIALGHIFPTGTKKMKSSPQGLERLGHYCRLLRDWPTVAIGGIKEDTLGGVLDAGAGSAAVVTLITQAEDPEAMTRKLLEAVHEHNSQR